ncbi:hypothetical protein NC653_023040 [Populus alba x Populus x berolinensis]|uniref:Uncharacterized protein n=1 Tax=Populus alba x Populus x berolinensis TaxID=444605 RepID=A0AAD6MG54_9ROSI|nr:hypothetical protein NC653_023040 [Populus alba x Populus x berolinensis]
MPLKPPLCHQYPTNGKFGSHSSTPTSPESQIAKIKISFSRRNVWNDDFDPFMGALKTVKGESYVILDTGPSLRTAQEPQDNPRKDLNDQS